jgi:Domain of unknown function (DUF4173)
VRALALTAAVLAAASLPYAPLGIGVPLVALLVAATVATAARRSLDTLLFGALALGLALMPALLDADWIVALDLAGACVLAAVAVAGPRVIALVAPARALGSLPELLPDSAAGSFPALRGLALGTFLVLPFGGLFLSADAAFAELAGGVPMPSLGTLPGRLAVFALVLAGALGLALAAKPTFAKPGLPAGPKLGLAEWAIPLVLLDLLFLAFVSVQVTVLFGGHDHVLETSGLTYAEYAREGFWQLIAAAVLTLVVVAAATRLAAASGSSRRLLRLLLGALCVLTLVIVASALHRLQLYEDAFGLTRARLAAETFTWGLGMLFVLVLAAGAVHTVRRELARVVVAGGALALIAFSASNPDGRVAARNVDRWQRTGDLDVGYVQSLSADAVPALAALPEPLRSEVLAPHEARLTRDEPLTSANASRRRARALLASGASEPARVPSRAR